MAKNTRYIRNERRFEDIEKLFSPDYKNCKFPYSKDDLVYIGYEHKKLPNETRIINLITENNETVIGSTMGHQHIPKKRDKREFQEIYEFLRYGGMFLRNSENTLYLLKPSEKVIVKNNDNMTLLNFDNRVLVTLDFANPKKNQAHKDLEKRIGTCLFIKYKDKKFYFHINPKYYEEGILQGINTPIILKDTYFGESLYQSILEKQKEFNARGIKVVLGGNLPKEFENAFQKPLPKLVKDKNHLLFETLQIKA